MTEQRKPIDSKALASRSVASANSDENAHVHHPRQNAGQDESIAERLERDPENKEARLDTALDESMDASDPPASTQPVHNHEPPESSGFDAAYEDRLSRDR